MSEHAHDPMLSPGPSGNVSPLRVPQIRLRMDVGTWTYGQPMAAGTGDIHIDSSIEDLWTLRTLLGDEGFVGWMALVRNSLVMPANPDGTGVRLELPGYSVAWLRKACNMGERAAARAARNLRESGAIIVAAMPGARGAEGKQRSIMANVVGLNTGLDGVQQIWRGRGGSSSAPTFTQGHSTIPTDPQNRGTDVSDVSAESPSGQQFPQVRAFTTDPQNRPSRVVREVENPSSLPSSDDLASLGVDDEGDGITVVLPLFASWDDLRERLAAVEHTRPGAVAAALVPVFAAKASNAGGLVKALGLEGPEPVAERAAKYLATSMTTYGGRHSAVWRVLVDAGIHLPDEPVDVLGPRLVAAVLAGLDAKVSKWTGWLGSGVRKPTSKWTRSTSIRALAPAVETLLSEHGPGPVLTVSEPGHDSARPTVATDDGPPSAFDHAGDEEPERRPSPVDRQQVERSLETMLTEHGSGQAAPRRAGLNDHRLVERDLPADVEADLEQAVAWGESIGHPAARRGVQGLRSRPGQAKGLVAAYREARAAGEA